MYIEQIEKSMYDLICETSTNLPKDVRRKILAARQLEDAGTRAAMSLDTIAQNINMADEKMSPICQDTGMPTFKIKTPVGVNQIEIKAAIKRAIVQATKDTKLRPNSVDSLTGDNSGDNLGEGVPVVKFEQWEQDHIEVKLILKGGGCENKNIQYSLPTELEGLGRAGRDLMASVNVFYTPSIKRKDKDVQQVSSVSESVATALLVTNLQKNNYSVQWTM